MITLLFGSNVAIDLAKAQTIVFSRFVNLAHDTPRRTAANYSGLAAAFSDAVL
jgi:hypothetical protein